jgi:hypothetical protein
MENQQLSKLKNQSIIEYIEKVHYADGGFDELTLPYFIDDLFLQYYTRLGSLFDSTRFTDDACKLVKEHREESEGNVMAYLKSLTFERYARSVIAKLS